MAIENLTTENIKELLKKYPLLHNAGYGYPDRKSESMGQSYIEERQGQLFDEIDAINLVICFLEKHATETKRITKKPSYRLKHLVEEYTGKYTGNGIFIAAALLAGYRMKSDPGYNPCFNLRLTKAERIRS